MPRQLTTEQFLERLKKRNIKIQNYDLSKVVYEGARNYVTLICPKHGEMRMRPDSLMRGSGCYECGMEKIKEYNDKIRKVPKNEPDI